MGGRRYKKNKKRRGKRHERTWKVCFDHVEMAAGHDGLLRGAPEPSVIVGSFAVGSDATPAGRHIETWNVTNSFPQDVQLDASFVARPRSSADADQRWVLLLIALERDSDRDLKELYQALEEPERWQVWGTEMSMPEPSGLADGSLPTVMDHPMRVLLDGEDIRSRSSDDIVAAAIIVHPASEGILRWRVRFCSDDLRNDWTLSGSSRRR